MRTMHAVDLSCTGRQRIIISIDKKTTVNSTTINAVVCCGFIRIGTLELNYWARGEVVTTNLYLPIDHDTMTSDDFTFRTHPALSLAFVTKKPSLFCLSTNIEKSLMKS